MSYCLLAICSMKSVQEGPSTFGGTEMEQRELIVSKCSKNPSAKHILIEPSLGSAIDSNILYLKGTRGGGKSSEQEAVAVIPIYCETC